MDEHEVLAQVTTIMREYFDEDDLVMTRETTAYDVPAWDSLSHVNIVTVIEQDFDIRFTLSEVEKLKSVGDLIDLIMVKKAR